MIKEKLHIIKLLCFVFFLYLALPSEVRAQNTGGKHIMHYRVINNDTVFVESIPPIWVFGKDKRSKKNWRQYYRLVHNFSKAYPYARIAKVLVRRADSTFMADQMSRRSKEKYINEMQKELFNAYEKPLRKMTITQGQLLIKLVDREVGKSSYNIIKEYKSGFTARFWQTIAWLFGSDLKKAYDPYGEDRDTEELIHIWERGEFPYLYYSIFGEYPNVPVLPSKYR